MPGATFSAASYSTVLALKAVIAPSDGAPVVLPMVTEAERDVLLDVVVETPEYSETLAAAYSPLTMTNWVEEEAGTVKE